METSLRKSLLQLWASPCQKSERVKLSLALSSHRNHLHQTQLFSSYLGNNFHQIFGHLLIFHLRPHQKGKYPSDCSLCLLFCATLTPAACAKSSLSCSASVRGWGSPWGVSRLPTQTSFAAQQLAQGWQHFVGYFELDWGLLCWQDII